jgi:hypothetical protein
MFFEERAFDLAIIATQASVVRNTTLQLEIQIMVEAKRSEICRPERARLAPELSATSLPATRVDAFLVPPSNKPSIFQPIALPFALNHGSSISCGPPSR